MSAPRQRPKWQDAYDAQMALWRWYRTREGEAWLNANAKINSETLSPQTQRMINALYDAEGGKLLDCDPIYVSADMCEVVDAARVSFAPEPLLDTDLPTHRGFMWYARPMVLPDRFGVPLHMRAMSWSQQYQVPDEHKAEAIARYLDPEATRRYGSRITLSEHQQMLADGIEYPVGLAVTLYCDREHYIGDLTEDDMKDYPREQAHRDLMSKTAMVPVLPMHCTPWWYDQEFDGNEVDENGRGTAAGVWWALAQTTFRMMQQRLPTLRRHQPERASRREARRLGFAERDVVVVRLRREESPHSEPSGEDGNFSHRWIVDGHWRNQWYPSISQHRQIWISPYVKGPADKPLVVRPRRVFQWDR